MLALYSSNVLGHVYVMWQAYFFEAYVNKGKGMYTSAPGHIVYYSEFIYAYLLA